MILSSFLGALLRMLVRLATAPLGLAGLLRRIGGVDAEVIGKHHERDRSTAVIQGALSCLNWLYISIVATFALTVLFQAEHDEIVWCAAVAMVIASMIGGVDLMIIRAAWAWHGMASLRQAGLDMAISWLQRLLPAILLSVRFGLSYLTASLLAALLLLFVVHLDLEQDVRRFNHQQNSALFDSASATVDARIADQRTNATRAEGHLTNLEAAEVQARAVDVQPGDIGVTVENEKIQTLQAKQTAASAEGQQYRQLAINEKLGRGEGTSGVPGAGPVYEADIAHAALAEQAAAQFADEVAKERVLLAAAQHRQDAARADAEQQKNARLSELAAQIAVARGDLETTHAAFDQAIRTREAAITELVEKNPAYVPLSNGPIEMFKSFHRVVADPGIDWWMRLIKYVAMGLELTAVLAKLLIRIPGSYSTEIAAEDCLIEPFRKLTEIQRVQMTLTAALRRHAASLNASLSGFARRVPPQQPPRRGADRGGTRRTAPSAQRTVRNE